ncbi:hypothetical protein [Halorhodospira halophila]|uniref:hypothetical protein n=1 Tax=Halorhodospira halophila TaxID=1053 RepID=UPI0019148052|nr:hypothetical protein [Halorhodospira halophila]
MDSRARMGAGLLLAIGLSPCAQAQHSESAQIVEVAVTVEDVAVLEVGEASGSILISDNLRTGWLPDPDADEPGQIRLATNFCVDAIRIDFPRSDAFRDAGGDFFGEALGISTGHTLGVVPVAAVPDPAGGGVNFQAFGGTSQLFGVPPEAPLRGGADTPFEVNGHAATGGDFCAGIHDVYLSVVGKWDVTLPDEPTFADPDTYRIELTATILP